MTPAKPSKKVRRLVTLADLAPRRDINGGSERRVFGTEPLGGNKDRTAMKKKDLPASKDVKGGRIK